MECSVQMGDVESEQKWFKCDVETEHYGSSVEHLI